MAHNLLGSRFYNRSDKPAWHKLGLNVGGDAYDSADSAIQAIGGYYRVDKRPIPITLNGIDAHSGYNFIVREPITEDPVERIFGAPVPDSYQLIGPYEAVDLYDKCVRDETGKIAPVETMGILGHGERMFISTKLPGALNIKGDEVVTYLLYDNPMQWGNAVGVYVTGIRTVCQNTLHAGINEAIERRAITHTANAKDTLTNWLTGIYARALAAKGALATAFTQLADTPVNELQVKWIVEANYPLPQKPRFETAHNADMEKRWARYEYEVDLVQRQRNVIYGLFGGEGVGMDTPAVKDTAFGIYNAVAEFETYRRGDFSKAAEGLVAGQRAARIRGAFSLCQVVDNWQSLNPQTVLKKVRV